MTWVTNYYTWCKSRTVTSLVIDVQCIHTSQRQRNESRTAMHVMSCMIWVTNFHKWCKSRTRPYYYICSNRPSRIPPIAMTKKCITNYYTSRSHELFHMIWITNYYICINRHAHIVKTKKWVTNCYTWHESRTTIDDMSQQLLSL